MLGLMAGGALLASLPASAGPSYPGVINVEQPDGTTLPTILRGDEHGHVTLTTDGYMLTQRADGTYVYAMLDKEGRIVESAMAASAPGKRSADEISFLSTINPTGLLEAAQQAITESNAIRRAKAAATAAAETTAANTKYLMKGSVFPTVGSPRMIVILVEFQNKKFSMSNPNKYFTDMLNKEGFSEYGGSGSVRDYFINSSDGKFTPYFDVYGPVKLANRMSYYGGNNSITNQDKRPHEIVTEACDALADEIDFSLYSTDGKNVDNVFVIYAGFGEQDSSMYDTIWPAAYRLSQLGLNINKVYNGYKVDRYGYAPELSFPFQRPDGIGTCVHEFSHILGLPDLYVTNSYIQEFTPNEWDALDRGLYNDESRTPPSYSSFERYCMGWINPSHLPDGESELENLNDSRDCFRINTGSEDEFYLLENRQQTGQDKFLPGHGLLVWHIDYRKSNWDSNSVNNDYTHQLVDILEADESYASSNRAGDTFPGTSNVTRLTSYSSPALLDWDGNATKGEINSIIETADGKIKLKAKSECAGISSVMAEATTVNGGRGELTTSSEKALAVFDTTGRSVGHVSATAPLRLAPGLYLVATSEGGRRVLVK